MISAFDQLRISRPDDRCCEATRIDGARPQSKASGTHALWGPFTHCLRLLRVGAALLATGRTAFPQATDASKATAVSISSVATAKQRIGDGARAEATKAIADAEKAAKSTATAASALDALRKLAAATPVDSAAVVAGSHAAVNAITAAMKASEGAVSSALAGSKVIVVEVAKAKADAAMSNASRSLLAATPNANAAAKADSAVTKATSGGGTKANADSGVTYGDKAVIELASVAAEVAAVAVEIASPSLPVTTQRDENVLTALRARLTGGAVFFNGRPNVVFDSDKKTATFQSSPFSQASSYFAFEALPRLFEFGRPKCPDGTSPCPGSRLALDGRTYARSYFELLVNVRLTTIAVAGSSNPASTVNGTDRSFLQSQKAALFQFGVVAPSVNFGNFRVNGSQFHWSVAPVARGMLLSVTDADRSVRLWDIDDDLYGAGMYGARVSLFEKDIVAGDTPRSGWSPAAYIDASWGQFQNFERPSDSATPAAKECLAKPAECLAGSVPRPPEKDFKVEKPWRMYIEGRLYLQYAYLGFDINNGRGIDDIRFVAGLTMKLDQFFTRR